MVSAKALGLVAFAVFAFGFLLNAVIGWRLAPPWGTYDKCFGVDMASEPPPHADPPKDGQPGDVFCVRKSSGKWVLIPGAGMEDWKAPDGGSQIPLDPVGSTSGAVKQFDFDVDILGHPTGGNHGQQHKRPDFGFRLKINDVNGDVDATIKPLRRAGGPIHGGSAHAQEV